MSVTLDERSRPPDTFASFAARNLAARRTRRPPLRRGPGGGTGGGSGLPSIIQTILGMIGGGGGQTFLSDEDIRAKAAADAQAIIGPLLARQQADYLARVQAGSSAIQGYTGAFADRVGALGPQVKALFAGTGAVEGAAGNALADVQGKTNMAGVKDLGAALNLMGAPHAGDLQEQQKALSSQGTRVTRTLTADELARMANEGGAQEEYYGKQPGIAGLEGGQILRDYLTQQGNSLASALADINQSLPGLVTSLSSDYRNRDATARENAQTLGYNKATLAANLYNSLADRSLNADIFGVKTATAAATLNEKIRAENLRHQEAMARSQTTAERNAETARHNGTMETIAQQNANSTQTRASRAGQPKPVTWRSVVDDARKTAAALATQANAFAPKIKPHWQQALNSLIRYLRAKYQHLTAEQVRTAAINGLYGAGYSPTPTSGAPSTGGPTSRNPNSP